MGAFLHILLCSAIAIGGYHAVGLTAQTPSIQSASAGAPHRLVEPGLMAVPIVRGSTMHGLAFLKLGLAVEPGLAPSDEALHTLIADALYDAVLPEASKVDRNALFDMTFLDLEAMRVAVARRVNEMADRPVVHAVMVLQLDLRESADLRSPTLDAVID